MCEVPCFLFPRMLHIKLSGTRPALFVHASCSKLKVFCILLVREENPA